ncbi:hypothetical protein BU23DRAFT_487853 [Bimuria novae-zelandiae CBS 107.79]|uniref:Uncharacterized protein n=1 Tax=Bimuria novae-zelandiae CBS 107.79 TaxID=1447943 RepID=A0A6A5UM00_9PLEO|nr:hypothetical protein BU23DRAFT_487853 [Bimuria novae-zelandiae CBS 107.79]
MPSSPLSPRMDSLNIPSQARRRPHLSHMRQSSGTAASLRLPSLPRFHPANYASSQGSNAAGTPTTNPNSPQPPLSPRAHQRQYSEVQRQMYTYQQQLMANAARQARASTKPTSPKLTPLDSPGPVTPMELEGADGYLTAGMKTNDAAAHVEKLIREEASRRGDISPGRTAAVAGR